MQRKGEGDLRVAEEYYSRAILADPEDGEVLSQYAKLIWESQHDKERATNYFERAIQASSENRYGKARNLKLYSLNKYMSMFFERAIQASSDM